MSSFDRRGIERFPLKLRTFMQVGDNPEGEVMEVVTRDICAGGALFHTDRSIPVGSQVKMCLIASLGQRYVGSKRMQIRVRGSVMRTNASSIVVRFEKRYEIVPLKN